MSCFRSADRVVRRFLASTSRTAVVAHTDPIGNAWGWFTDNVPRMHLEPMSPEQRGMARIWLERRGYRCFEVDYLKSGTGLDLEELRMSVVKTRDTIEGTWLRTCALRGWLHYSPRNAAITLYANTPCQMTRRLRESVYVPEFLQLDADTNSVCLEVRANRVIWWDANDGAGV
jgi:hypothetical protein